MAILILILGAYGALTVAKYHERAEYHHAQKLASEDQSEPIAHAFGRTLTTEFTFVAIGGAR